MKPCIVVVGYNRPKCLERILNSVANAVYKDKDIPLVISLDKASDDKGCLKVANDFVWEHGNKIVRTFDERKGLRKHILMCGDLTDKYGSVIILEDDLLVSPMFYEFASNALETYKDDPNIAGVSLYSHEWNGYAYRFFQPVLDGNDVYLGQYSITWGECWTKEWWNKFKDWYSKHQELDPNNVDLPSNINKWPETSWGKYFVTYIVENNLFYVIPAYSMTTNCSVPGQHAKSIDTAHQVRLLYSKDYKFNFPKSEDLSKYDVFFESISLKEKLEKELNDSVTINLSGKEREYKSRYLLTTLRLSNKVVKSYGLELRPIDVNVANNISGSSIYLYDLKEKASKPASNNFAVLKYEFRDLRLVDIRRYYSKLLNDKIGRKLKIK